MAGPADPATDVRLGVTHAPYLRVLDQFAADGYDAIIAGHTHGGQVCLPGGRALTTNCDLEPARARGLHRHPADSEPGDEGSAWLHVSAGLGTNPYVRIRVACRPEATLMTLVPRATRLPRRPPDVPGPCPQLLDLPRRLRRRRAAVARDARSATPARSSTSG